MLFGPAYKGIRWRGGGHRTGAARAATCPSPTNRKEAKDHGEGGTLVGARWRWSVLIVDDVISAGTSVRESIAMIQAAGATPAASRSR